VNLLHQDDQLAGMLLKLRKQDGRMSYMKLINLMYLIDREALLRWGWSMTGDAYHSMEHGCLLTGTYDLLRRKILGEHYWFSFISPPFGDKQVKLLKKPEGDELSKADRALIAEMYERFGRWDRYKLAQYTQELPEYRATNGPSIPITYCRPLYVAFRAPQIKRAGPSHKPHPKAACPHPTRPLRPPGRRAQVEIMHKSTAVAMPTL
jgi:hypothetical protein